MLQPFEKFRPEFIRRLVTLDKPFLVSQSYTRGFNAFDEKHPIDILLTDYDDSGLAKTHLNALKGDPLAALVDLKNQKHVARLTEMMEDNSHYRLFWAVVPSAEELKKKVELQYTDNVRRYLLRNTDWNVTVSETIRPSLKVIFGEIYMIIRRGSQHELRVKFAEIEKA